MSALHKLTSMISDLKIGIPIEQAYLHIIKHIEFLELKNTKLEQLILLTDPAVADEQVNTLTVKQWTEYQDFLSRRV